MMKKDSKIFVAGGTGLVGSAIIKNLMDKGYENIVANYHNRKPNPIVTHAPEEVLSEGSTAHIAQKTNSVRYVQLDLLDAEAVENFFAAEKPEFVFLAAAKVGGIVANNTYRADFIYENLQIQNNVIHQSYVNNVKKLMFLGSTCIYPRECPQPMKEEYLLTSPLEYTNEPYAIAKIAGIKTCESYNLQYGTNYISVMPTNLYGPNDNFDLEKSHVLPALIRKIHLGKCLERVKWDVLSATKKDEAWEAVKEDMNRLPIESITGENSVEEILAILDKYGIKIRNTSQKVNSVGREAPLGDVALNTQSQTASRSTSHVAHSTPQISIEIWGTGKPMREFLWSEDMADACVFLMKNRDFKDIVDNVSGTSQLSEDGKACEAPLSTSHVAHSTSNEVRNTHINIGTGRDVSIADLAAMIKEIVGFRGELYFNTDKPDGTMKKLTDVTKLHALGWHHKVELREGIERMYRWYIQGN